MFHELLQKGGFLGSRSGRILRGLRAREQRASLDPQQRGGYLEEFRGRLEIDRGEELECLEVLRGDVGQRHVLDRHFVPAHEVQEQIQGAVEVADADAEGILGVRRRRLAHHVNGRPAPYRKQLPAETRPPALPSR